MYLKQDVIFSTTDGVCGREIRQHMGILMEKSVIPADSNDVSAAMDHCYAALAVSMNIRAKDIGADAVVGVDFRVCEAAGWLIFTMTGNAVRLRDSADMPGPVSLEEEIAEIEALDVEEEDIAGLDAEFEALEAEEKELAEFDAEIEALDAEEEDIAGLDAEFEALDAEEEIPDVFIFEEAEPEKEEEAASWKCASCGTENDPEYRFCPGCGEMRRFDWKCDGCGQQNPAEYTFCPGCGRKNS